ncbi:MAG: GNAT family N-acetyltransferase [Gemmataceae bacterium]
MIRATVPDDTPALLKLTEATGVFRPLEIVALQEVLDDYHGGNREQGHLCVTEADAAGIRGFAYYAPAAMTLGTWYLWWIAVATERHGQGIGTLLLQHLEKDIDSKAGRHLLVETSSMPHYEPTRRFYEKHGYQRHAVLEDYYAPGDSMVVYRKLFQPRSSA